MNERFTARQHTGAFSAPVFPSTMLGFLKKLFGAGEAAPPPRFGMDELARRLGLSADNVRACPIAYHTFEVPKRTGGVRTIAAPADPLKQMQRRILHRLLRRLRAHPCATGFERGHSIVTNAQPHVRQQLVIKLDLQNFFGATSAQRIDRYFRFIGWDEESAALLTKLCTHEGSLPQGAPTSPRLSNLVNFKLDARLFAFAQKRGLAYSRYADDITFSGPATGTGAANRVNPKTMGALPKATDRNNDIIHAAKAIVRDQGYELHTEKKLRIARRHDRQIVTGLVVNEKVNLSRRRRRWLRAVEHHLRVGKSTSITPEQLAGWKALQSMVTTQRGAS